MSSEKSPDSNEDMSFRTVDPFKFPSDGHGGDSLGRVCAVSGVLLDHKEPPRYSGTLDHFRSFDPTPNTGREFPDANLADWLRAPNSDDMIRDLAITGKYFKMDYEHNMMSN